jgi:uncharacterized membrane protein
LNWSTIMSWPLLTALILIVAFACAFGVCEWFAGRRADRRRDDDHSAMG